jgi:hypothetical protein
LRWRSEPGFESAQTFLPRLYAAAVSEEPHVFRRTRAEDEIDRDLKRYPDYLASVREHIAIADRAEAHFDEHNGGVRVTIFFKKGRNLVGRKLAFINIPHGCVFLNQEGVYPERDYLEMQIKEFFTYERLKKFEQGRGAASRAHNAILNWTKDRSMTVQEFLRRAATRGLGHILGVSGNTLRTVEESMRLSGLHFG